MGGRWDEVQAQALALLESEADSSRGSRSELEEACESCSTSGSEVAAPGSESDARMYTFQSALNSLTYLTFELSVAGSAERVGREACSALAGTLLERLAGYVAEGLPNSESSVSLGDVNQCWTVFLFLHRAGAITEAQLALRLATLAGALVALHSMAAQGAWGLRDCYVCPVGLQFPRLRCSGHVSAVVQRCYAASHPPICLHVAALQKTRRPAPGPAPSSLRPWQTPHPASSWGCCGASLPYWQ